MGKLCDGAKRGSARVLEIDERHCVCIRTPCLGAKGWARSISLGLHGDAGASSKQESIYLFTWNSLLGAGSTSAKRFVFTLLKKSDVAVGTLDEIMRIFAWSMNSLLTGIVPRVNWLGLPVASTDDYIAGG